MIAVQKLSTLTPGNKYDAKAITPAFINSLRIKFIYLNSNPASNQLQADRQIQGRFLTKHLLISNISLTQPTYSSG